MERLAAEKGAKLDDAEQDIALQRIEAAQAWLEHFAPPEARLQVHYEALPGSAGELSPNQRRYLGTLAEAIPSRSLVGGEAWQALIFEIAKSLDVRAADAFGAIYRVFLDRPNGPRAGWLLASLSPTFVIGRLHEAARGGRG
jgi:lysyl-tRNA synthetase class 1